MLLGLNKNNQYVYAQHASNDERYRCPTCGEELVLKKGKHMVAHFAHKVNITCYQYTYNKESVEHLSAKHTIYKALHGKYSVNMEYYLSEIKQTPDIIINEKHVIEFQFSPISLDTLIKRTRGYHSLNLNIIWIGKDIHYSNGMIKLTQFEAALINHETRTLLTYHYKLKKLYIYEHIQALDMFKFICKRREIEWIDLFNSSNSNASISPLYLTNRAYNEYLMKCKKKNSALEPTLSLLYQARLLDQPRMRVIGIIVPEQIYILTNCITWQLYVYFEMNKGTFSFDDFCNFLKVRIFYKDVDKRSIVTKLLNTYLKVLNKLTISRAK